VRIGTGHRYEDMPTCNITMLKDDEGIDRCTGSGDGDEIADSLNLAAHGEPLRLPTLGPVDQNQNEIERLPDSLPRTNIQS